MISFLISIAALVLGYLLYGAFVDHVFGPDPSRKTPAIEKNDGVDFLPLPNWKVFMIQFLNIAPSATSLRPWGRPRSRLSV